MNKLPDIIRLVLTTDLSDRDIGHALQVAKNTVRRYRGLVAEHGLTWDELKQKSSSQLDAQFNRTLKHLNTKREPDYAQVREELKHKGVTLMLLWEEYRSPSPDDALSYSQFTNNYRNYINSIDRSMRQVHRPGEMVFVDYSGRRPSYTDSRTGKQIFVELFVGALGYSHCLFAIATPSQTLPDWVRAHVRMFEFYGGVPLIVVPDNLKSAVTKPGRHPLLNRTYQDMARYYNTTILPARPRKPQDKAKVENGVQVVQRWILARIRNRQFFSLEELNQAIAELLQEINIRPFKRLTGCRRSKFEDTEKAYLQPLPSSPYEYAEWSASQKIGIDYHMLVRDHWYSVPHQLVGEHLEARVTTTAVEFFHNHCRIAVHIRSFEKGGATTLPEHQHPDHRAYAERTPECFTQWAKKIGPNTLAIVQHQFEGEFPMLGLPACDRLRKLARQYGEAELESAAQRAVEIKSLTVKSVRSLLSTGRYRKHHEEPRQGNLPLHHNVRGPDYYAQEGDDHADRADT